MSSNSDVEIIESDEDVQKMDEDSEYEYDYEESEADAPSLDDEELAPGQDGPTESRQQIMYTIITPEHLAKRQASFLTTCS